MGHHSGTWSRLFMLFFLIVAVVAGGVQVHGDRTSTNNEQPNFCWSAGRRIQIQACSYLAPKGGSYRCDSDAEILVRTLPVTTPAIVLPCLRSSPTPAVSVQFVGGLQRTHSVENAIPTSIFVNRQS